MQYWRTVSNTPYWRQIIIFALTLVYILVFFLLFPTVNRAVGAFVILPVCVVSILYGWQIGIIAAILSMVVNTVLYNFLGYTGWDALIQVDGVPGQFAVIFVAGVVGVTRNIYIEKVALLNEAGQINRELETFLEIIPDILFRIDMQGVVKDYRAGHDSALAIGQPVIGKNFIAVLPQEIIAVLQDSINDSQIGKTISSKIIEMTINNRLHWYQLQIRPLTNGEYILLLRDLTQQKRSEKQLLEITTQQNRIEYLQEFITNLSHDLNTPLTIIKTNLYLLERFTDPEKQNQKLEQIKLQTQHLEKLISDIIMLNKLDSQRDESLMFINLNEVIKEVLMDYQPKIEAKGLQFISELPEASPMILANISSIDRVMSNLLDNALSYTDTGQISVRVSIGVRNVIIKVQDTGIGMREDEQARIFERFFRADKARSIETGGAGLGLSIAHRIVDIHQGTISVESQVGKGSTFTVELPLFQKRADDYIVNIPTDLTTQTARSYSVSDASSKP